MTEVLTAEQMRAIEQAAIKSGAVSGLELMERAGRGVVEAICDKWPEFSVGSVAGGAAPRPAAVPRDISEKLKRAAVLCGPGNNGGDGFVVARLLKERGWAVKVFLYGDAAKLPADAKVNYQRWCELGAVQALSTVTFEGDQIWLLTDLVVDALFGTGLTRAVDLPLVALDAEPAVGHTHQVVAIDLPSGLCSDSGRVIGEGAVQADLTVTFHRRKCGHVLADGPEYCGSVVIKDIGLAPTAEVGGQSRPVWRDAPDAGVLAKGQGAHKFTHGHALILSGGAGRTGAARLAARGALRIGAGLVTLGVPPSVQMEVACQITALMLQRVGEAGALREILSDDRINAVCLGPGLGQERARELVPIALQNHERAVVLDADALSAFGDDPQALFDMLHNKCVLTPHGGEFARLFPDIAQRLAEPALCGPAYSKLDATREAARRAGATVLFKGADTVIAEPDGACSVSAAIYDRSAPWLATAGAGDVLAGFITGLLARGVAPHEAAATAAWLHVGCARSFGAGLIAEDLPEQLPKVFSDLGI
ncbi:bifunctional ADP-dependent NAD(P)H-hydrate dehydratase/NAD(P)H-hydrate epimerase [Tritonibacter mobilis]|uniref:bifunctional ADP-dependent NAD(P)H-hydrate dehydratase/NAD(P)H-hydrate epimerase n=1 Tax=Tritonibacter mobilis TaxID=379347 RepID=UPI000806C9CC|nr:bifunctional ADP-dependent NAD(P)H-hydrate dehydratase/NAD(P)H-hydrate epimerase [Tritonibacter mobilis]GLP88593.1 bifunctional NAD(P)H-hydrate repair enzyme [Tritonibacter mobilis]SDX73200.1 yjeF C-terminal region, hydroxyethylthiazole kinase-related/yjeF N-terminal region [Tritonibacter mobilis]